MPNDIPSDIKEIYSAAVSSANGGEAVRRILRREGRTLVFDLPEGRQERTDLNGRRLFVVGAGKAAASMAEAVEDICRDIISDGIISVKTGHAGNLSRIRQIEASHPVPDENGIRAAQEILSLADRAEENDLILSLVSGGASALTSLPCSGITLAEKQKTTELLLSCGAPIEDINCVRKHLSAIKGGRLARSGFPARMVNLCISDVVGDDLSIIGSGLFSPDPSTFADAEAVLKRHGIHDLVPEGVLRLFALGEKGMIPESPKSDDPVFSNVINSVCMSNHRMLESAQKKAEALGYDTVLLSASICGDTTEAAEYHSLKTRELLAERRFRDRDLCILSGGETTVKVKGSGKGGRNTEFTLRAALACEDLNLFVASIGTDGTDGPTDAAGSFISTAGFRELRRSGLVPERYAEDNDSYSYFSAAGTLIKTGPTGTNVLDLRMVFIPKDGT